MKQKIRAIDIAYGIPLGAGIYLLWLGANLKDAVALVSGASFIVQAMLYFADRYQTIKVEAVQEVIKQEE